MASTLRNKCISNENEHFNECNGAQNLEDNKPCLKHSVYNMSRKLTPDSISEVSLCKPCSKSMLSYIFLIQDTLDALARKIHCGEDSSCCMQCLRQEYRRTGNTSGESLIFENHKNVATQNATNFNGSSGNERDASTGQTLESNEIVSDTSSTVTLTNQNAELKCSKIENSLNLSEIPKNRFETIVHQNSESHVIPPTPNSPEITIVPKRPRKTSSRRNSRRISREIKENIKAGLPECYVSRDGWQTNFLYNVTPKTEYPLFTKQPTSENNCENQVSTEKSIGNELSNEKPDVMEDRLVNKKESGFEGNEFLNNHNFQSISAESSCNSPSRHLESFDGSRPLDDKIPKDSSEHYEQRIGSKERDLGHHCTQVGASTQPHCSNTRSCLAESQNHDILVPSKDVHEHPPKTSDQSPGEVNTLHDSFSKCTSAADQPSSEAFVTICRNNAEALGCLVLGSSLLLSCTSRKLCVLVFDDVDAGLRNSLSSVFHTVQYARHLNSFDATHLLEKLNQKGLEKLNIWRLFQYTKCVFLNPDCLTLRNCDELFQHDELSAVPDIGWPDCFNSGVFVFVPSITTFSKLVELSMKQEKHNGGDQILLNTYFNSWSCNISNKLSFIYNLMRNTSYSYTPAFHRFGQNIKIVQFLGASKPWHVKFFTQTGQIDEGMDFHPIHNRFISEWINIFKIAVLRLLPQEVYSYVFSQKTISAEDITSFFSSPAGYKELNERKISPPYVIQKEGTSSQYSPFESSPEKITEKASTSNAHSDIQLLEQAAQKLTAIRDVEDHHKSDNGRKSDGLPGANLGDYHGMQAWEQGQMDYEGSANSENIINRLKFLIHQSL